MDKVVEIGFGARTAQVYSFKSQSFWLGLHVCSTCRYMFVTSHIDDSLYTTYVTYVCCLYIQNDSKLLTPKMMVRITLNTQYEPKSWSQTITVKLWALGILMYLNVCIAMNHCNSIYIYELPSMYVQTYMTALTILFARWGHVALESSEAWMREGHGSALRTEEQMLTLEMGNRWNEFSMGGFFSIQCLLVGRVRFNVSYFFSRRCFSWLFFLELVTFVCLLVDQERCCLIFLNGITSVLQIDFVANG